MKDTTTTQISRWYRTLWRKVTEGDGWQPWGYDYITMSITHPGFFPAKARLKAMYQIAKRREEGTE